MHYPSFAGTKNGKATIVARFDVIEEKVKDGEIKEKNWGKRIPGQRYKLSARDIQDINDKYKNPF